MRQSAMLRLWLDMHPVIGLLGGIVVLGGTVGILAWLVMPLGRAEPVVGQVLATGMRESENGSFPTAVVRVDGREVRVELARYQLCRPGDRIKLLRRPIRLGTSYTAAYQACREAGMTSG